MPLHRIHGRVKAHTGRPVTIFDLDSTLISTQRRNHAIVKEWAERAEATAALRAVVDTLTAADMGWNAMDDLRRRGLTDERELRHLRGFWYRRFFTDDYLVHDEPIPGAAEYVGELHADGALVVYLTGRPAEQMGAGTRASLTALGFPVGERTQLFLKPTFTEDDLAFKRRVCGDIGKLGDVVGAFENEPANANLFADEFPDAEIVLLETMCSPGAPAAYDRIARVKHFHRAK